MKNLLPRTNRTVAVFIALLVFLAASACMRLPRPGGPRITSGEKPPVYASDPSSADEKGNIEREFNRLLISRDFDTIDSAISEAREKKIRIRGGYWKLDEVYGSFNSFVADYGGQRVSNEMWADRIRLIELWAKERPDSIAAKIALADAHVQYGFFIRGSGYIDSVSQADHLEFQRHVEAAESKLTDAQNAALQECPRWFRTMLHIGMIKGWPARYWDKLFDTATKREPNYLQFYLIKSEHLTPKWNGMPGEWQEFLDALPGKLANLGTDEADLIYLVVAANKVNDTSLQMNGGMLSKERLRKGFELLDKRYGCDNLRLNQIAYVATFAMDFPTAKRAFDRIEYREPEVWSESSFTVMKKLAESGFPQG